MSALLGTKFRLILLLPKLLTFGGKNVKTLFSQNSIFLTMDSKEMQNDKLKSCQIMECVINCAFCKRFFSYTYGKSRSDYSESIQVGNLTRNDEECSANTLTAIAVTSITVNLVFSMHSTKTQELYQEVYSLKRWQDCKSQ